MPRTIAALFDDSARAQGALQALMTAGLSGQRTALIGGQTRATELGSVQVSSGTGGAQLNALPAADRTLFEAGLRRGGSVLLADIAGDMEEAVRIVETFEPADLDGRTETQRKEAVSGPQGGVDIGAPLGAGLTAGMGQGNTNLESVPGMGAMVHDPSTLGTADLRTDEMSTGDQDRSTVAAGAQRSEERAGAPGALELGPSTSLGRIRLYGAG